MNSALPKSLGRDRHLDGLRGVAALIVVIEHVAALLPIDRETARYGLLGELIRNAILFPLQAGNFAVYVFFAISGVVVAAAAAGKPILFALPARYLRLTMPMLVAGLLAWVLLGAFPGEMPRIATFLPNHWTTTIYQGSAPSFWSAFAEPLYRAYLLGDPTINPVLWSMRIELWGSFGIFVVYGLAPSGWRSPVMAFIAFALLVAGLWAYLAFPIGAALYDMRVRELFRWSRGLGVLVAVAGVLLGVVATLSAWRYYSLQLRPFFWAEADLKALISTLGGLLIVVGVLASETGKAILTSPIPIFLGRISYGLYLTHMPILYGAFAALYLLLGHPPAPGNLIIWAAQFFAVAIAVALAITVFVDEPATRLFRVRKRAG